ncbi:tRNA pseudouridine(13) synthase TruD [Luteimonas sp. e5]
MPRAHGAGVMRARMRAQMEDFHVEEIDAFAPSGSGEHLLLTVEKRGMTTAFAARGIARWAGVAESAIGHAGLKDRHAVTRQRFSVWLPKKRAPDLATFDQDGLRVLEAHWHSRKLPRGALAGNRFALRLRAVSGDVGAIEDRLRQIAAQGVPNYFGEQRFGRHGDNVQQALAMFAGRRVRREERSLLLSAARSALFNAVLGERVRRGDWDSGLEGDVFMLDGRHSIFGPEPLDEAVRARLANGDIHATGPLWGRGELRSTGVVQALEQGIAARHAPLCAGLEAAGMRQERRSLRLWPRHVHWHWPQPDVLELGFELPAGSYATSVLHALGEVVDAQR